jgi:hypothetical protein
MENTSDINLNAFAEERNSIWSDRSGTREDDGTYRTALGHEATPEFHHVAKAWSDRCKHIAEVSLAVLDKQATHRDFKAGISEINLTDDLRLGGARFTDHGLATLTRYLGMPSLMIEYMRERGYVGQLSELINDGLHQLKRSQGERTFLLRTTMGDDPQVNAVLSDSYSPIDHLEVIDRVCQALPQDGRGVLATQFDDDGETGNLVLNLLLPDSFKDTPESSYGCGISVANGRLGLGKLTITPYIFRAVCWNGTRWGWRESNVGVNQKHSGRIDRDRLQADISRAVRVALSGGHDLLALMDYTRDIAVTEPLRLIASLCQDRRLSTDHARAWVKGFDDEPADTAFGVVGGLTRGAQALAPGIRNQLEEVAGAILVPSLSADRHAVDRHWSKLLERAHHVSDGQLARIRSVP